VPVCELVDNWLIKSMYLQMGWFDRSIDGWTVIFFHVAPCSPDQRCLNVVLDEWIGGWRGRGFIGMYLVPRAGE
jgi:hypothetical protein